MKTTVRLTITLPEGIGTVQRLYDHDTYFHLEEETMSDTVELALFLVQLKEQGGKQIFHSTYISDDDLKEHSCYVYEYCTQ